MVASATSSSLDVAYWFFNRAEQDRIYLETEKLHHILFWAQNRYAQNNHHMILMPCVFLCDESGFFEPNLKRIFEHGRPFMPPVHFDAPISSFLEQIWNDFKNISPTQCKQMITQLPLYNEYFRQGVASIVPWEALSNSPAVSQPQPTTPFRKKILVSQNGPVVVSPWAPRKVSK